MPGIASIANSALLTSRKAKSIVSVSFSYIFSNLFIFSDTRTWTMSSFPLSQLKTISSTGSPSPMILPVSGARIFSPALPAIHKSLSMSTSPPMTSTLLSPSSTSLAMASRARSSIPSIISKDRAEHVVRVLSKVGPVRTPFP